MLARFSDNRFNQLLNKPFPKLKSRWRLVNTPSQPIQLRCLAKTRHELSLLTSESAQNKGVVDPKVQATAADVKGKGLLLEEEDLKPRRPVTTWCWWTSKATSLRLKVQSARDESGAEWIG
jgi:hypothetical protein